ncbi:disease resistance protein RGA1 [Canna indica]|uniref:Disease resistance protein RGA1 n=1 Tax=Canna indica TaxID=4628 RepID=A0AAQ3QR53_9LILI|nr:disease resistance protein RGA1 [Canna indica]
MFISSIVKRIINLILLTRSSPSSSSSQTEWVSEDLVELQKVFRQIRMEINALEERVSKGSFENSILMELKDVSYEAEDVLDEYQYEIDRLEMEARPKRSEKDEVLVASSFMAKVPIPDGIRNRMKQKINEIKTKYGEISRDRGILELPEEIEYKENRNFLKKRQRDGTRKYGQTTCHVVISDIYGRDSEKEELIRWLLSDTSSNISVKVVVGIGGLGKTTLAQLVFNDETVSNNFDQKAWICVSENFDVARLTKEMLEYFSMNSLFSANLSELQNELKRLLKGTKLLLVLDDVWNEENGLWESFRALLTVAKTVRVIVTTRSGRVADVMQTEETLYLSPLPQDESWELFQRYAFNGRNPNHFPNLVEIGKMIAGRCQGLPLAVKSLGCIVRQHETDEDSWKDVLQSELWELEEHNSIMPVFVLSYSRMPSYLKPCFLYCSMFPKDYKFRKEELVKLWIAQGYIQPESGRTMEYMGSEYFDELHNISFFDQSYDIFKMHDTIHDLAQYISGNHGLSITDPEPCSELDRVRHIYIGAAEKELITSLSGKKLRPLRTTFLRSSCKEKYVSENLIFSLITTSLRALHIDSLSQNEQLLESIGNLKLLRYLYVCSYDMVRLHKSLGDLLNLQMLDLQCPKVEHLPSEIGDLVNLHYLRFRSEVAKMLPASVSQLSNLLALDLSACRELESLPESIYMLCNLQKLDLTECSSLGSLPESICKLYNLRQLNLSWCSSLSMLPSNIGNLRNMEFLDLYSSRVKVCPSGIWKLKMIESFNTNILHMRRDCMPRGIGELKELVNLAGLEIHGLNYINVEEAKEANLKSKQKLKRLDLYLRRYKDRELILESAGNRVFYGKHHDRLRLNWVCDDCVCVNDEEKMATVLEYLQPSAANLEELHVYGHSCARYPSWIDEPSFNKLTRVTFQEWGNEKLTCLPVFGQLPSLQDLRLKEVSHVKSVAGEFCRFMYNRNIGASEATKVAFPSMTKLQFEDMPDWEEWYGWLHGDFPQLKELIIIRCSRLRSIQALPSNLESIYLSHCPELASMNDCPKLQSPANIPLQANLRNVEIYGCPKLCFSLGPENVSSLKEIHMSGCAGLHICVNILSPKLRKLHIHECPELQLSGPQNLISLEYLEIRGGLELQLLSSSDPLPVNLKKLRIEDCLRITTLGGLQHLNSLDKMEIINCPELQISPNDPLPVKLQKLQIKDCLRISSLTGLQRLSFLEYMEIDGCPELQLSPDDMLPANLRVLRIKDCLRITSLAGLQHHNSLYELKIISCPELQISPNDPLPVKLRDLRIEGCLKINSLVGLQYLDSLLHLHISGCPEFELPLEESLPKNLHVLEISDCPKITSLVGLHDITSLEYLYLARCHKIQLPCDTPLISTPYDLEIVDCPGLREYCNKYDYGYGKIDEG